MADRIGPTFASELAAVGCPLDGLSWSFADGTLLSSANPDQAALYAKVLAAHDPTKQLPPTVTGNQWGFALSDLGLSSAWRIGVTKSKDSDQVRVALIARDTALLASDPLLIRVAANAGTTDGTATGPAIISVPAVFTHAQGMPL